MKTFRHKRGHVAGSTMTVGELRVALDNYPDSLPVFAAWEGVRAYVKPEHFSIERVSKGHPDDECDALVIDVDDY